MRPTANQALRRLGIAVAVFVAVQLAIVFVGSADGRLPWPTAILLVATAGVGVAILVRFVRRVRHALLAELQRGYVTVQFVLGGFWIRRAPGAFGSDGRLPWDWTATWVLRPDGTVRSSPGGDGDPPGLYPSPRDPSQLELWTGCQWTNLLQPNPLEAPPVTRSQRFRRRR